MTAASGGPAGASYPELSDPTWQNPLLVPAYAPCRGLWCAPLIGRRPTHDSGQLLKGLLCLLCRGETWLSELLDRHAAAGGSPAEQAQAAASCLGLDLRTDGTRQDPVQDVHHSKSTLSPSRTHGGLTPVAAACTHGAIRAQQVLVSLLRQFALGSLLPAPPVGARGWTLPQVVERMRRAYCGTLAVELDHLYSSVSVIPVSTALLTGMSGDASGWSNLKRWRHLRNRGRMVPA